jgi:hypothetical protein
MRRRGRAKQAGCDLSALALRIVRKKTSIGNEVNKSRNARRTGEFDLIVRTLVYRQPKGNGTYSIEVIAAPRFADLDVFNKIMNEMRMAGIKKVLKRK